MTNLHVTLTSFRYESRLLKETQALIEDGIFASVLIVALHEAELPKNEHIDEYRHVRRIALKTRNLPKNIFFQSLKYFELTCRVLMIVAKRRISVVNVHSLALLPVGFAVKCLFGAKLVYDAHELETEVDGLVGHRYVLAKLVERMLLPCANLAIVVGPQIANWYRSQFPSVPVVSVLNCPRLANISRSTRLHKSLDLDPSTRILLYQGVLSSGRGIEEVLRAFTSIPLPGWTLVFMGYGPLEHEIKSAAATNSNVRFQPAVSPHEVLDFTASAHIGVCLIADTCLSYRLCLPNKLFEYSMAGLPVLCSELPEMARVVSENGIGFLANPAHPEQLALALREALSVNLSEYEQRAREFSRTYCWENQKPVMIQAYREHVVL